MSYRKFIDRAGNQIRCAAKPALRISLLVPVLMDRKRIVRPADAAVGSPGVFVVHDQIDPRRIERFDRKRAGTQHRE